MLDFWREFHGPNAGYLLELYERYQSDPGSLDEETRRFFETFRLPVEIQPSPSTQVDPGKAVAAAQFAEAVRHFGHLAVQLDPLGTPPRGDPALDLSYHGLTQVDLEALPSGVVGGPVAMRSQTAWDAIHDLQRLYTGATGFDYGHIDLPEERQWLREAVESRRYCTLESSQDTRSLLERLTQVEVFERFLHRAFPGRTRFSIEGLDMLVPMLDQIIANAVDDGVCMVFLGMAHRGRLNILAHILNRTYEEILAEFKDTGGNDKSWQELGWTGDVKYHRGGSSPLDHDGELRLITVMPPNPSHLELINPVVAGMARAAATATGDPGKPRFFPKAALPVLIHGDAAFTGEGIVTETLNLARIEGYTTAGTVHIIANNQLGYTTPPQEERSTLYASDIAKAFKIPIIHVCADDPVACIEAACTASAYRSRFHKDFLIDLVGYRRYGHNEGDEPSFTQPLMYEKINSHPTVRKLWADELIRRSDVPADLPDQLVQRGLDSLQAVLESLKPDEHPYETLPQTPPRGAARSVQTAIPLERLASLNASLLQVPEGFQVNRKLDRFRKRRQSAFDDHQASTIDWAAAEELALATILEDGIPIRVTGQDVERGTFSQRHAVLHDSQTGATHTPLAALPQACASFEIHNSPLSEAAALGFEFGINIQSPERLVLWEAQYADFVNNAQSILDEFILSARARWGQAPSLGLLLPHGNEGQGPDHSSARPERFLQLAAENNFRLAYPTTAAQYFHLLRRHAALLKIDPLPLVVLTPKGMLRHPATASAPRDLAESTWQRVIPDQEVNHEQVRRLVLCSGRVYVDITASLQRHESPHLAVARVEQLYPFPEDELRDLLGSFPALEEVDWVQEEPQNMGFWDFMRPRLQELIGGKVRLHCIARLNSSSPAEGSTAWYQANQKALMEQVYETRPEVVRRGIVVEIMT